MGMSYKKSFSLTAIPPAQEGLNGKIEFRTNDMEVYSRVTHYITTLIDAEQWRRHLHEIKHIAMEDEG